MDPETLFDRFRKDRRKGDGLGLGLAIVKKICDFSGFQIRYTCENDEHTLEILFQK
jgi:signal transduction histidine kinase